MQSRPEYGSDVIVDLLDELGIEFVACNPGATFRGIHDSLVNYREGVPEIIECTHEEISVAIAHGYAKAAGRPMAAAVHDVVGLQHASMAVYNAWCDRAPVLVLGGTGPVDAARRRPWIDWIHTANVQATQVRDYTRWDDQPASIEAVPESLVRAYQLATGAPPGPVYVCFDSDVQEERLADGFAYRPVADYAAPGPVAPDPAAVERIARWLLEAEAPVIAVETVDRSQAALDALVEVAEQVGAAVLEPSRDYGRPSLGFPSAHPLNATGLAAQLPEADVVVSLEVRDLAALHGFRPRPDATIALVGTAQFGAKAWAADLQRLQHCRLSLPASSAATALALRAAVRALVEREPELAVAARDRAKRLAELTGAARERWAAFAAAQDGPGPVHPAWLAKELLRATTGTDPVIANGSAYGYLHRLWDLRTVDSYLGSSGGAGLGYGIGAAIGAGLAHRDTGRLVVDIQSDGDFMMTPGALWTAAHHRVPMLVVMDNNRAFNNSVMHADRIARDRGRDPSRAGVGTAIDEPAIDFAAMARSMGVTAFGPCRTAAELPELLDAAVAAVVEQRVPVLVDVLTWVPDETG